MKADEKLFSFVLFEDFYIVIGFLINEFFPLFQFDAFQNLYILIMVQTDRFMTIAAIGIGIETFFTAGAASDLFCHRKIPLLISLFRLPATQARKSDIL